MAVAQFVVCRHIITYNALFQSVVAATERGSTCIPHYIFKQPVVTAVTALWCATCLVYAEILNSLTRLCCTTSSWQCSLISVAVQV